MPFKGTLIGVIVISGLLATGASAVEHPGRWEQLTQSGDPGAQLTYASIMFYEAKRLLGSEREQGVAMFKKIERLLGEALRLTEAGEQPHSDLVRSQAFFLLAEIARYVFQDTGKAKAHYEAALEAFPSHAGAVQGLGNLMLEQAPPKAK